MLPENFTAILARNEDWSAVATTEPYEAGWAREAVIFVRTLKEPQGPQPKAIVELSPDGIRWLPEGSVLQLPDNKDGIAMARIAHFGNWLRLRAVFDDGASSTVIVTLHLKS